MKHWKIYLPTSLALLAVLLLVSACATSTPSPTTQPQASPTPASISVTDGLDRQVVLEAPAQKIVSLAPSNTEILFAIGAGAQVVGKDFYSDYPAEAADVTAISDMTATYNLEAIVGLEPDLVLAAEINAPEQVAELEKLGLNVYWLANPTDFAGVYENLLIIGQLTGHTTEAEQLVESLKARVSAVEEKMSAVEERPLVFYELDATDLNAPYTSGPGTFVDYLLDKAGALNLGSSLGSPWAQISLEELVVQNPDVILLGDAVWGGYTAESVAQRAGWEGLTAVQNEQVFPFDDNLVSRPGPRMVDGLEQLARLLHPELFE